METPNPFQIAATLGAALTSPADDRLTEIQRKAADLIDLIGDISVPPVGKPSDQERTDEIVRQKELAQAAIREAVDWANLAAAKPPVTDE